MTSRVTPDAAGEPASGQLDDGWVLGEDGTYFRRAARVILLDEDDRVLLLRGHDVDQPERAWWFTVGGGIDPDEDARAAAVREVREEVGVDLDPSGLVGPVFTRSAVFDFYRVRCRQDEEIFLGRLTGEDPELAVRHGSDGWTAVERDVLDEVCWWDLDALAAIDAEVFPEGLAGLVRDLLAGWDGITRHLVQGGD